MLYLCLLPLQVELGDAVMVRSPDLVDQDGNAIHHIIRVTEIFYSLWVRQWLCS